MIYSELVTNLLIIIIVSKLMSLHSKHLVQGSEFIFLFAGFYQTIQKKLSIFIFGSETSNFFVRKCFISVRLTSNKISFCLVSASEIFFDWLMEFSGNLDFNCNQWQSFFMSLVFLDLTIFFPSKVLMNLTTNKLFGKTNNSIGN